MSTTIEASMRHVVPPAKRESAQKHSGPNELSRRRERKLRVVFAPSPLTPSPQKGVN